MPVGCRSKARAGRRRSRPRPAARRPTASRSRSRDRRCSRCARCRPARRRSIPRSARKYFSAVDRRRATCRSSRRRRRALQRERRDLLGDVVDRDVEARRVLGEPAQVRIGGRPAIHLLRHPRHRAIVDDLAVFVAPRRVVDLADRHLRRVARDDAIDEPHRVGARHAVLEERRDVDQRAGVADGVVFVLVMRLVGADGVVAGPVAIVEALAQLERACVEGGTDRHAESILVELTGRSAAILAYESSDDACDTTRSSSAAGTTGSPAPPISRARDARSSCSSGGTCSAAPPSPKRSFPASSSRSARTSSRCCGRRSFASSTCRATAWSCCRSTARSRRCRTAITCGASTITTRRGARSRAIRGSTPRPTTSTARRWSRWAASPSRSSAMTPPDPTSLDPRGLLELLGDRQALPRACARTIASTRSSC